MIIKNILTGQIVFHIIIESPEAYIENELTSGELKKPSGDRIGLGSSLFYCLGVVMKRKYAEQKLREVYWNMIYRCHNPKNTAYHNYGGRGIYVCDEWRNNIVLFFDFALSNGWTQKLQIDRTDNDKGYYPSNVRFVTRSVNVRNRRCSKKYKSISN